MTYVTFIILGRTGNNIGQYLTAKTISLLFNKTYIPIENIENHENQMYIDDNQLFEISKGKINIDNVNIVFKGFFQNVTFVNSRRKTLLELLPHSDDYWYSGSNKVYIRDFFTTQKFDTITWNNHDVVIHLRLDDFIHEGHHTTNLIHPNYYLNTLKSLDFTPNRVFIVCDILRQDWERRYLDYFSSCNPIICHNSLYHDCEILRNCPILIHSNSTFCWFQSFLSTNKTIRYIPLTYFHNNIIEELGKIEETDILQEVSSMTHEAVNSL